MDGQWVAHYPSGFAVAELTEDHNLTALAVRLPKSVYEKVRELAIRDEISVNPFIAAAVSEKMASVLTLDDLKQEAQKRAIEPTWTGGWARCRMHRRR